MISGAYWTWKERKANGSTENEGLRTYMALEYPRETAEWLLGAARRCRARADRKRSGPPGPRIPRMATELPVPVAP